jgi:protein-S-isoprenylcysteine O-methyltransferase Ste14
VTLPAWIAAIVLFLQLPIPLYWFVVHPGARFWRRYPRAVYVVGLACSWLPATAVLVLLRRKLFRPTWPSIPAFAAGLVLVAFEIWMFWRAQRGLGTARLVGKTEISGAGEIECGGIYATIRHPRYTASFLAIVGACILAGTRLAWAAAATWLVLMSIVITLEEREMRARFGVAYAEYCREVPRFMPRKLRRN